MFRNTSFSVIPFVAFITSSSRRIRLSGAVRMFALPVRLKIRSLPSLSAQSGHIAVHILVLLQHLAQLTLHASCVLLDQIFVLADRVALWETALIPVEVLQILFETTTVHSELSVVSL